MRAGPRGTWRLSALLALALGLLAVQGNGAAAQAVADQLAACKNDSGSTQTRIDACTWVIGNTKDNDDIRAEALLQRGVLNEFAGNKEAAIEDYSAVIELDSTSAVAFFNRGNVHDQQGDYDRAIADYTEAIKLDASDPDVFNNRGQAYDNKGEYDLAIADYSESIRLNRDNPRAFFNRGLAHANKGDYQRAIDNFSQAIKLEPRDADAYVSRGAMHEELGNETAARADYNKALEIAPEHEDAKEALARLGNLNSRGHSCIAAGRMRERRRTMKTATGASPDRRSFDPRSRAS